MHNLPLSMTSPISLYSLAAAVLGFLWVLVFPSPAPRCLCFSEEIPFLSSSDPLSLISSAASSAHSSHLVSVNPPCTAPVFTMPHTTCLPVQWVGWCHSLGLTDVQCEDRLHVSQASCYRGSPCLYSSCIFAHIMPLHSLNNVPSCSQISSFYTNSSHKYENFSLTFQTMKGWI